MGENRSLCVIFYSVTLTVTLKFLFKAYCHDIYRMLYCAEYFLREKLNITEMKKLVNKYCQFLQFMTKIIRCTNPPFYANFLTL